MNQAPPKLVMALRYQGLRSRWRVSLVLLRLGCSPLGVVAPLSWWEGTSGAMFEISPWPLSSNIIFKCQYSVYSAGAAVFAASVRYRRSSAYQRSEARCGHTMLH